MADHHTGLDHQSLVESSHVVQAGQTRRELGRILRRPVFSFSFARPKSFAGAYQRPLQQIQGACRSSRHCLDLFELSDAVSRDAAAQCDIIPWFDIYVYQSHAPICMNYPVVRFFCGQQDQYSPLMKTGACMCLRRHLLARSVYFLLHPKSKLDAIQRIEHIIINRLHGLRAAPTQLHTIRAVMDFLTTVV